MNAKTDLTKHTRITCSYLYANFILCDPTDDEVVAVNEKIIARWSISGLIYIKEKAWKMVNHVMEGKPPLKKPLYQGISHFSESDYFGELKINLE